MIAENRTNGGRSLSAEDRNAIQREKREAVAAKKMRQRRRTMTGWAVFLIGNGLMLYMIQNGLINEAIGMGCLIGISFGVGRYGR